MDQAVRGILIHTTRYSDQAIIARIFTESHGLKSFIVRSGKTLKSSKSHYLQPLNVLEFEMNYREQANLHNLKNIAFAHRFTEIPFHPIKGSIVLFMDEIIHKTLEEDYSNPVLYHFLVQALLVLDSETLTANFPIWFLLELSRHYGFYPQENEEGNVEFFDLNTGVFCKHQPALNQFLQGEGAKGLAAFVEFDYSVAREVPLSPLIRRSLLEGMVLFLQLHLQNVKNIRSLAVLKEVFG